MAEDAQPWGRSLLLSSVTRPGDLETELGMGSAVANPRGQATFLPGCGVFAGAASAVGIAPPSNGMETSTGSTSCGWADTAEGSWQCQPGKSPSCHHAKHPEAPCSHRGGSTAEAKVPPEALSLRHRTRGGRRAASKASQVGSVILEWLLGEAVVKPQGQLGGQRCICCDSLPFQSPHRDGLSDSSVSCARGDTVPVGGHHSRHASGDTFALQQISDIFEDNITSSCLALPRTSEDTSAGPGCDIAIC